MILKKPYAFIIKHFRMIHLLLLLPISYLLIKTNQIRLFFKAYVNNDYSLRGIFNSTNLASNYINILMYLAIIIILFVFVIMIILFQRKDKPTRLYSISVIYYLSLFIILSVSFSVFNKIEVDTLSQGTVNIVKDLSLIIYLSEYIFGFFTLLRGVGFDIKRFNFKTDIRELQIDSADSEEFEFILDKDNYKTKRNIRRFFMEFKYYYLENKFIFTIIFIALFVSALVLLFTGKKDITKKVYKEGEALYSGGLSIKINDSFVSSLSFDGNIIDKDKSYVILKVDITNNTYEEQSFNYGKLVLRIGNKTFGPDTSVASKFIDYGIPYVGTKIKGMASGNYIFVYPIDKNLVGQNIKANLYIYKDYLDVEISPEYINDEISVNSVNMGTTINIGSIKNSTVNISSYEVMNRFTYTYNYCSSSNNCYDLKNSVSVDPVKERNKTLMLMDFALYLDSDSYYMEQTKTYKSFFSDFLKVRYYINGEEYIDDAQVSNPNDYNEKLIVKVSNRINNAEKIDAVLNIRNYSYVIKLK